MLACVDVADSLRCILWHFDFRGQFAFCESRSQEWQGNVSPNPQMTVPASGRQSRRKVKPWIIW